MPPLKTHANVRHLEAVYRAFVGQAPWGDRFRYQDAFNACRNAAGASWALFFLTAMGRLEVEAVKGDDVYVLVDCSPITDADWASLKPASEVPEKAIADLTHHMKVNESGFLQAGVTARCRAGDGVVFSWGDTERSEQRSLAMLSEECSCKARRHETEEG